MSPTNNPTPDNDSQEIEVGEPSPEKALVIENIARQGEEIDGDLQSFLASERAISEAEARMDEYDVRPTLAFVASHHDEFESSILCLAAGGPQSSRKLINDLSYENFDSEGCQIPLPRLKQLLFSLPPGLIKLSTLRSIKWSDQAPVPEFDQQGNFTGDVSWHDEKDFIEGKVHPSRIFIGYTGLEKDAEGSTVTDITLTRIPSTVSDDRNSVFHYQVYVLLHEFMHTVINPVIHNDLEDKMIIGEYRTMKDWMAELMDSVISGKEPVLTSDYAETYLDDLKNPDPKKNIPALVELICETFVAYMLNIMPNKHNYSSFDSADFGGKSRSTDRYRLIKELCNSQLSILK